MIEIIFYFGTDIVMVRIRGHSVTFVNSVYGALEAPIDGIKLNQAGVIKEHPDLIDRADWKEEAIKRFKECIYVLKNEESIAEYIIQDLKKYGYVPKWKQKAGFRRVKIE